MVEERVIINGDMAVCNFGTVTASVKSVTNMFLFSEGKTAVLNTDLVGVFGANGFGVCRLVPNLPKPCLPVVTMWSGMPKSFVVDGFRKPLTNLCKGSCVQGGVKCIRFI